MVRRGSITVFLALILSLTVSLVCTGIESVRMAAARTQILNSVDIGLYSLFAQYDRELLQDFDVFFLDGSGGKELLDLAGVYDSFSDYMKPVLKQNSQKLSVLQGGFTGYRLATDEGGEPFYRQVVHFMKETLGSHGVSLLLSRMKEREKKTQEAQSTGEQAKEGEIISRYDSEMTETGRKNQEAVLTAPLQKVTDPVTVIRRIMKMGILELVIPGGRGISEKETDMRLLLSRREQQKGLPLCLPLEKDSSYLSAVLYQQYLLEKLGNYRKPGLGRLQYQTEYILGGKKGDIENLKYVANRLLLIREGVNLAHLAADGGKRAQAAGLAAAVAASFLIPPATAVLEAAILLCWAFGESILDVRELFDGGRVPLVKGAADWQLSLENLPQLLNGLDSERRGSEEGMSYEDYLQVLLMGVSKEKKLSRGMDMVEMSVQDKGRPEFRLDSCINAMEVGIDVKANRRKVFQVIRSYEYD